jgi:hypothetical protein
VLGKVDSTGGPVGGDKKTFDVDTVCIGYGLIPTIWLTSMLGCTHTYNPLVGGWIPSYNENMQTDQPGVFVAGDGAGIAGVLVAKREGRIAGLYAAAYTGMISTGQAEQEARSERKQLDSLHSMTLKNVRVPVWGIARGQIVRPQLRPYLRASLA